MGYSQGRLQLTRVALAFAIASPILALVGVFPVVRSALYLGGVVLLFALVAAGAKWCLPRHPFHSLAAVGLISASLLLVGGIAFGYGLFLEVCVGTLAFAIQKLESPRTLTIRRLRYGLIALSVLPTVLLLLVLWRGSALLEARELWFQQSVLSTVALGGLVLLLACSAVLGATRGRRVAPGWVAFLVAAFCISLAEYWLFVPTIPPVSEISYNYSFYLGAALQAAYSGHLHFGVSQYGTGPILSLLAASHFTSGVFTGLALALLLANATFAALLAMMARRIAGSMIALLVAIVVPLISTFSISPIVVTPSVAGLRFLPLAVLGLLGMQLLADMRQVSPAGRWTQQLALMCATSMALAVCVFWAFDVALMSAAFSACLVTIAWSRCAPGAALRVAFLSIVGLVLGVVLALVIDHTYFARWALESSAVIKAYSQGLGYLPVFTLFETGGTSLWAVPLGVVLCAIMVGLSDRSSLSLETLALSAWALTAFAYFVGRAHPNNLLHVAPFFAVVIVACVAHILQSRRFGYSLRLRPIDTSTKASMSNPSMHFLRQRQASRGASVVLVMVGIIFVVCVFEFTDGKRLAYRQVLGLMDTSALQFPNVSAFLDQHSEVPVLMAVGPIEEFRVRMALERANIATFGLPEQDSFGGGPAVIVADAAARSECLLIIASTNADVIPETEANALVAGIKLYPLIESSWSESGFRVERRAKIGAAGC